MINIIRGDITTLEVDAIVNAANRMLVGGGGVDGAIHVASGFRLAEACKVIPEVASGIRCPIGESRITRGFDLLSKYVIHTVGPVWRGGESGEEEQLANCYKNSLALAFLHDVKSIAFPAISCGAYWFPVERACEIALREVREFLKSNKMDVTMVAFEYDVKEALEKV